MTAKPIYGPARTGLLFTNPHNDFLFRRRQIVAESGHQFAARQGQPHKEAHVQQKLAARTPDRRKIAEALRDLRVVASASADGYSIRTNRHVASRVQVRSPGARSLRIGQSRVARAFS